MSQPLGPLVVSKTNPRYFAIAPAEGVDEKLIISAASPDRR
jgi:hypothetical protein